MKALLVRIGIDQSYGRWNAPVDAAGRFVFVPIPESSGTQFHDGLRRGYGEVLPALNRFCTERNRDLILQLKFPEALRASPMHLDPDFDQLTYGDDGSRRGSDLVGMTDGDLLVLYSGLRPVHKCEHKLLYAIVGVYVVQQVVRIGDIPAGRWHQNAHTRKKQFGKSDVVVLAKPGVSGRLEKCIPIGEWRDGAYRVRTDLLEEWGGLSVKDGFIQRSIVPPSFLDAPRFQKWIHRQDITLIKGNGWI